MKGINKGTWQTFPRALFPTARADRQHSGAQLEYSGAILAHLDGYRVLCPRPPGLNEKRSEDVAQEH